MFEITFGKHKGKLLDDVMKNEPSYIEWVKQQQFAKDEKASPLALLQKEIKVTESK